MIDVRTIDRGERDAVLDLLRGWLGDRDFFRRYFDYDPAFRDDLCVVATDEGRIVSTLQVFPKRVRLGNAEVRVGGIGNVYTDPSHRGRGVASDLLRHAIGLMEAEGFELSMLFASRLDFYGQFGWVSHRRLLGAVMPPQEPLPTAAGIRLFDLGRDLDAVMAIYDAYSGSRSGAVVRDRTYWKGQLCYAGNPTETFLVAEKGGRVVAYARLAHLYGVETVMEHGALPGFESALVDILCALAEQSRSAGFMVVQLGAHPELAGALRGRGCEVNDVEDVFWMWRLVDTPRLARALSVPEEEVRGSDFLERVLPYTGSVYWISDRF